MNKPEVIYGTESVEDLISMLDRNENKGAILALISLTTKQTNPATYNQFVKKLRAERREVYDQFSELFPESKKVNSRPCFVATATMGDINNSLVIDLRVFRDTVLVNTMIGRAFIYVYDKVGPYLAKVISHNTTARFLSLHLIIRPLHYLIIKSYK